MGGYVLSLQDYRIRPHAAYRALQLVMYTLTSSTLTVWCRNG